MQATVKVVVLAAVLTGCAPSMPQVTVTKVPAVHRPEWLKTVNDDVMAIYNCSEDLPAPAYTYFKTQMGRSGAVGVALVDGRGRGHECVWSLEEGVIYRRSVAVAPEEIDGLPLVTVDEDKPAVPMGTQVEPVREGDDVLAWIVWM